MVFKNLCVLVLWTKVASALFLCLKKSSGSTILLKITYTYNDQCLHELFEGELLSLKKLIYLENYMTESYCSHCVNPFKC